MRIFMIAAALAIFVGPNSVCAMPAVSPAEQFDLDCAAAALRSTSFLLNQGTDATRQASDQAYETTLFYEGRLTARDDQTNWLEIIATRQNAGQADHMADLALVVQCQTRQKELLHVPVNGG